MGRQKMSENFDVGKLMRGFNLFSGANIGKVIYTIVIVVVCIGIYYKVFVKREIGQQVTQTQEAQFQGATIDNVDLRQMTPPIPEKLNTIGVFGGYLGGSYVFAKEDRDDSFFIGMAYFRRF